MTGDRGRGLMRQLHPEPVVEDPAVPVAMIGAKDQRKLVGLRAVAVHRPEHRSEQIAPKVRGHVPTGFVLGDGTKFGPFQPTQQIVV